MTRLIDADELKKALKSNCKPEFCHDYNTAWCEHCCRTNDFEDLIDDAPTVEERPHGKWITTWEPYIFQCSHCCGVSGPYNFCPNCGANMRGDAE